MSQSLNKLVRGLVPPDFPVPDIAVSGLKIHSDNIVPGDVFIAIPGLIQMVTILSAMQSSAAPVP